MTTPLINPSYSGERGYILVIALMVSAVLTLFGLLVLHTVWFDSKIAYADRQSQTAFHLAEAGLAWGMSHLNEVDSDFSDFDSLLDEPPLECAGGTDCPCELTGWRPLVPDTDRVWYPTGDPETSFGWFRVVVKDDVDGDNGDLSRDNNQTVLLRSYGVSGSGEDDGARRMIEVAVTRSY